MNGFIYLVEGLSGASEATVAPILPHVGGVAVRASSGGPNGTRGDLFARSNTVTPTYAPERQTWKLWKDSEGRKIHIGWENAHKPGPQDLQRKDVVEGGRVVLGDGCEWIVPRLRFFPVMWDLNGEGDLVQMHGGKYRALVDDAQTALNDYLTKQVPYSRMLDIVVRALSINYHVCMGELVAMGAMGTDEVHNAFKVLTQFDEWMATVEAQLEAEKKTE